MTTPSTTPLRFGIIGTGGICRGAHSQAFKKYPAQIKVVSCCDPNPAARQEFAALFDDQPKMYATHTELVQAGGIDAAILTLPHFLHFPVARDLIDKGIPVLIEKPAVCTLAEMRALMVLATQRKVAVVAGQNRRFHRDAIWIQRWAKEDAQNFGQLVSFDLQSWQNINSYTGGPERSDHWILDKKTAGGGIVMSVAIHQLDFIRFAFGVDYTEVTAHGRSELPFKNGAESTACALFKMSNGASGTLHAQYKAPRVPYCESMKAFGEQGSVVQIVEKAFSGDYEGIYHYASAHGLTTKGWMDQFGDSHRVDPTLVTGLDEFSFNNQTLDFADCVRTDRESLNSLRHNFNTLATIEALYASLASGRPESVATA